MSEEHSIPAEPIEPEETTESEDILAIPEVGELGIPEMGDILHDLKEEYEGATQTGPAVGSVSGDGYQSSELFILKSSQEWLLVHQRRNGRVTYCRGPLSDAYKVTVRHEPTDAMQYQTWMSQETSLLHSAALERPLDIADVGPLLTQMSELGLLPGDQATPETQDLD